MSTPQYARRKFATLHHNGHVTATPTDDDDNDSGSVLISSSRKFFFFLFFFYWATNLFLYYIVPRFYSVCWHLRTPAVHSPPRLTAATSQQHSLMTATKCVFFFLSFSIFATNLFISYVPRFLLWPPPQPTPGYTAMTGQVACHVKHASHVACHVIHATARHGTALHVKIWWPKWNGLMIRFWWSHSGWHLWTLISKHTWAVQVSSFSTPSSQHSHCPTTSLNSPSINKKLILALLNVQLYALSLAESLLKNFDIIVHRQIIGNCFKSIHSRSLFTTTPRPHESFGIRMTEAH